MERISKREATALINSLGAGVVPRIGLRHIAVGRQKEVNAFLQDLSTIEDGGGACRFVCGQYGSGKSFLLQMIRNNAMERSFVVMDADLSPERRLTGTNGQGLATYRELMQNVAISTRPDGGALEAVMQKWISSTQKSVALQCHLKPGDPALIEAVSEKIRNDMNDLSELAYGFSFSSVIDSYWRAIKTGNDTLKQSVLRWIRGEYATKTEAKNALPVDCIIEDQSWYEFLKIFAAFTVKAGFKGLVVFIDEGVNLYKINNSQARSRNYEKILTIFNDTMQGKAKYIGVFFSGTPQFVYDERRGLFSYEALRSRLAKNEFSSAGLIDMSNPVIELIQLKPEEIYLLLERLCVVHSSYYSYECPLGKNEITEFMNLILGRLGADQLLTPREVTRSFINLLNVLHDNPDQSFESVINRDDFEVKSADKDPEGLDESNDIFSDFDI